MSLPVLATTQHTRADRPRRAEGVSLPVLATTQHTRADRPAHTGRTCYRGQRDLGEREV